MPTLLSDKYAEVFAEMASSEEEDKEQLAADEFARAVEEADEIHMQGALRVDGNIGFGVAPIATPSVTYDAGDLATSLDGLITALENLGLVSRT